MKKAIKDKYYTKKKVKGKPKRSFNPLDGSVTPETRPNHTNLPDGLFYRKKPVKKAGTPGEPNPNAKQDFDKVLKAMIEMKPDELGDL